MKSSVRARYEFTSFHICLGANSIHLLPVRWEHIPPHQPSRGGQSTSSSSWRGGRRRSTGPWLSGTEL